MIRKRKEEYKRRLTLAQDAVMLINLGDHVVFGGHNEQLKLLPPALFARRDEPSTVTINFHTSILGPAWL